ncbi:Translation initiation factor 2 subunit alpha [Bienertia sinuspersici]
MARSHRQMAKGSGNREVGVACATNALKCSSGSKMMDHAIEDKINVALLDEANHTLDDQSQMNQWINVLKGKELDNNKGSMNGSKQSIVKSTTSDDSCVTINIGHVEEEINYMNSSLVCYVLRSNPPLNVMSGYLRHIANAQVKTVPIWIKLPHLDIKYWGEKCLMILVSSIGEIVKVDGATKFNEKLYYARLMIEIAINVQLPDHITIDNEKRIVVDQQITYEWVLVYYTTCKGYGH